MYLCLHRENSGPWFIIKMSSYQYRKSHCGGKTILPPSCLHNGISNTGKTASLKHLISTMGFPILVRQHLYIESGPSTKIVYLTTSYPSWLAGCLWLTISTNPSSKPLTAQHQNGPQDASLLNTQFKFEDLHWMRQIWSKSMSCLKKI